MNNNFYQGRLRKAEKENASLMSLVIAGKKICLLALILLPFMSSNLMAAGPTTLTFTFINSTGNGVTGTVNAYVQDPAPVGTFNFAANAAAGVSGVSTNVGGLDFSIDFSASGGGVEQKDSVTLFCQAQNPTFPPGICAIHPGYATQRAFLDSAVLTIATVNGQRRLDGGNFPSLSFINNVVPQDPVIFDAPKLSFSSTLGGDAITFNGTTTMGDWVIGNSVLGAAPAVSAPSSSTWSLVLLSLLMLLLVAYRKKWATKH